MSNFINELDGLLLGDGCVPKLTRYNTRRENTYSYRYTQTCIYKEWLEYIGNWLLDEGSFRYGISKHNGSNWTKHQLYSIQSQFSYFFEEQRNRWYKEWYPDSNDDTRVMSRKIVPNDIELTPECVANWYMGDGSISKRKGINSYIITFYTNSFTKKEVEYLINLLNKKVTNEFYLNKTEIKKSGEQSYTIQLGKRQNIKEFLEYIKPYIVPCFNYKIPEVN